VNEYSKSLYPNHEEIRKSIKEVSIKYYPTTKEDALINIFLAGFYMGKSWEKEKPIK
jgi:hypothetical protein